MEHAYLPHYDTRVEQLEKDIAQVLALPVTHQLRLLMEHVQLDREKTIGDVNTCSTSERNAVVREHHPSKVERCRED